MTDKIILFILFGFVYVVVMAITKRYQMINNEDELELNRAALHDLEAALIALKRKIESRNPSLFNSMAESYYKDIIAIKRRCNR